MIRNDTELQASQERIAYFQSLLAQMRTGVAAEVFPSMASGYRAEVERMQKEVLDYLTRHVSAPLPPAA